MAIARQHREREGERDRQGGERREEEGEEEGEAEDGKWTSFTFRLATLHDPLTESITAR